MKTAYDPMMKRSVDSEAMVPYWDKVDAIIDGIDGMRAQAHMFLPKFTDEDSSEYDFRLKMTKMTNVYRDIIEGLASKPFEQNITFADDQSDSEAGEVPQSILDFSYDVDGSGNDLTVFAANTFFNGINSAVDWIMVDYPKADPSIVTVADQKAMGRRPYWSHILGRNVLDARSAMRNGVEVLTYVKIFEPGVPDHIREFTRFADGRVEWVLYERGEKVIHAEGKPDTFFFEIDRAEVSIGEIPMVPFYTGRRDGRSWKLFPAMQDAADLQVELYQQESGLKFAKILTAYPMLAANGISPPKDAAGKPVKLAVGPNRTLYSSPGADGKIGTWSYVEPNAESLKFLAEDIASTIQNLRELGRQPLTASSSNITVITAAVAAGKAKSAVKAWAYKLKDAIENALLLTAKWQGISYDPSVHVFVDFDDWMEGEDLPFLQEARKTQQISQETYWEEAARRGVFSTNFTVARERARLLTDVPVEIIGPDVTI
jgi:Domain of unknown function (DUF4055)